MSEENRCRLCVTICDGYKKLYDENGLRNDVYEITVKFFDPAFLNMEQGKDVTVICMECWQHVSDFHIFKQSVHLAQSNLIEINTHSKVSHESQTKLNNPDDMVLVVEDKIEALAKRTNLNDEPDFKFSSESEFINKSFGSNNMDIIEVSLDNISNDYITSPDRSVNIHLSSNENTINESYQTVTTVNKSPSKSSFNADTTDTQRRKPRKRINPSEFIAEWREKLKCVICEESCSSLTVLRKHFFQNHPKQDCYVSCCQRKFNRFDLIEDHIRLHIDPKSFRCEVCLKYFSNSRILCEHLAKRHFDDSIRTYNCPKCKKCFHSKDRRKYHLENHCTNMCRECGRLFRTEVRRKLHERMVHNYEDPVCKQCGKAFQDKLTFQEHLKEHADSNDGMHMCTDCGKVVSTVSALRCHKRSHEAKEIRHKCPICKDIFTGAVPLREHMGIHTGIHTYTCPYCPMTFQYRSRMHYHRRNEHASEIAAKKLREEIGQQEEQRNDDDDFHQVADEGDLNQLSLEMET